MLKSIQLLGFILVSQLAGIMGSIFTMPAIPTWYASLNKPVFRPPNWLFGPVWVTLYTLMGLAAFLIFQKGWEKPVVRSALAVFLFQLILNALWSYLFFGLRNPFLAFMEIIFLWFAIVVMIVRFYQINRLAGVILIPYLLWVSFASFLTFSIYRLNP